MKTEPGPPHELPQLPETVVVLDGRVAGSLNEHAIEAAGIASIDLKQSVVLVGPVSQLNDALANIAHDAERLSVLDASLEGTETRPERGDTITEGLRAVLARPNHAFVSGGKATRIVSASRKILGKIPGIRRPALAAVFPTIRFRGEKNDPFALVLDVGASVDSDFADLVSWAIVGASYEAAISVNARPRVALLSNRRDLDAAPQAIAEADARLRQVAGTFEYIGVCRADDAIRGEADVLVCDGFSGNVFMRTMEGVSSLGAEILNRAQTRFRWRVGVSILGAGVEKIRAFGEWENYGGAPLLGVNRTVVITETGSDPRPFVNAIKLAAKIERLQLREQMTRALALADLGVAP